MNQPAEKPPEKFTPLTADQLTPQLLEEALATARRYDRNFANKEGSDAIPVPARTCRLLGLAIIHLHNKLQAAPEKGKEEKGYMASVKPKDAPAPKKTAKAPAKKKPAAKAKKAAAGPTLTAEQAKAFEIIKGILAEKQRVTSRMVAERGGWASHNSGARHIKNLVDLGYLKRVGKQQVIALTGIEP